MKLLFLNQRDGLKSGDSPESGGQTILSLYFLAVIQYFLYTFKIKVKQYFLSRSNNTFSVLSTRLFSMLSIVVSA